MPGGRTGGAHDHSVDCPSPSMPLLYALPGFEGGFGGEEGEGGAMLRGGSPASGVAQAGKEEGGAECELLPSPFLRPSPPVPTCPTLARRPPAVAVAVCFEKNTALSRGWCTPLTRGSAVCGAKRIAQHANPGLLSSPVRLSAFSQNVIKRNQPLSDTPTVFHKFHFHMTLERKKQTPVCMFLSKRGRPTGGKKWTWTRPFARPRPSSTSDEGGSVVPNSRLITAVIWISRIPMDITGPLGSTQTTTTATAMRQKTRPPRNQTRAEWEMEWKARRKRWELWRAIVSIMSGELRSSSGFAVVTRRTAPVG